MANHISIVIIAKNEERIIAETLRQAVQISDDVILADTGSTDNTIAIAEKSGARVMSVKWLGFGPTKNYAVKYTKHSWILSLDADEVADEEFISFMKSFIPDRNYIYKIKIDTYYAGKLIRNPVLSPMLRYRLYHKDDHEWNENLVHEKLTEIDKKKTEIIKGSIDHFSYQNELHQIKKCDNYARSQAEQWIKDDKIPDFFKLKFSSYFRFIKHYFLHFGFLYGYEGFIHAKNEYLMIRKQLEYYKELKINGRSYP